MRRGPYFVSLLLDAVLCDDCLSEFCRLAWPFYLVRISCRRELKMPGISHLASGYGTENAVGSSYAILHLVHACSRLNILRHCHG